MSDVTRILHAIQDGDEQSSSKLLPLLYNELRRLASAKLAHERPGQTLTATALVHEAYLRLVGANEDVSWENRGHFFAAAAEAMRRILVDRARRKGAERHGGDRKRKDLDEVLVADEPESSELLEVHEALDQLDEVDKVKADLVKLRYFAGLTGDQTAQILGLSPATVDRYWVQARAWLYREIQRNR